MNSGEVAGSILTHRLSQKKKKRDFLTFQEPVKLNHSKTTMKAMYRIIARHSNTKKVASWKLNTGYLIGVPVPDT